MHTSACTQSTPAPDAKATPETKTAAEAGKTEPAPTPDAKTDKAKPRGKQVPPPADVAAAPADATKTATGLAYKVLGSPGDGPSPKLNDSVKIEYTAYSPTAPPSSLAEAGKPRTVAVAKSIPGWTEGLQLMHVGETTRFWIPEELAYKGMKYVRPACWCTR
ncbi:MAG: FKBP-type peptidyl-prolyl cis-trans isomerase [Nannocystaceae bacterium]